MAKRVAWAAAEREETQPVPFLITARQQGHAKRQLSKDFWR